MQLRAFEVAGYRSLRRLSLELLPLTVVAGANGAGKTNVYRALHLLHAAATGALAQAVADEGGLPSLLWAGGRGKKERARVELEARWDELSYAITLGLEPPPTKFPFDPHVKDERVGWEGAELCRRGEGSATARDGDGNRVTFPFSLEHNQSILAQLVEPHRFPVLSTLKQLLSGWRF